MLDHNHEQNRQMLQVDLDRQKTAAARNRLGQFSTPIALATEMLKFAMTLLGPDEPISFLDPAIGTGAFYSALRAVAAPARIARAEGFEIDRHYALPAQQLWADTTLRIGIADFMTAAQPTRATERFNLVICNPPYVRHHHLGNDSKTMLQRAMKAADIPISGLAGLYSYFLCLSQPWMATNGVAGWLVPSEFMDVNYGAAVKLFLLNHVELLRIHRFDPAEAQFSDAIVSSAAVWFRNRKTGSDRTVEFTYGGSLLHPLESRAIPVRELRNEKKWTRFPGERAAKQTEHSPYRLADFFTIKRGIATGANQFFILSDRQVTEYDLPPQLFQPILPSPRYLAGDEVLADADGNPLVERKLFVLKCNLPESQVQKQYPALWRYLQGGIPEISGRYLCKSRTIWYAQDERLPAPFVCTYMGRGSGNDNRPFRFIFNHSRAIVANVYLNLYPKPRLAKAMVAQAGLTQEVWKALNAIDPSSLRGEGRVYGGGLHKLEPKELGNVPAGSLAVLLAHETGSIADSIQLSLPLSLQPLESQ